MISGFTPALTAGFDELKSMTQFTLLPAYIEAPGFDAYKTALKVRPARSARHLHHLTVFVLSALRER